MSRGGAPPGSHRTGHEGCEDRYPGRHPHLGTVAAALGTSGGPVLTTIHNKWVPIRSSHLKALPPYRFTFSRVPSTNPCQDGR